MKYLVQNLHRNGRECYESNHNNIEKIWRVSRKASAERTPKNKGKDQGEKMKKYNVHGRKKKNKCKLFGSPIDQMMPKMTEAQKKRAKNELKRIVHTLPPKVHPMVKDMFGFPMKKR